MKTYVLVGLIAAAFVYLATPLARHLALQFGAITPPRDRDVHVDPIPRMGGVALYAGVALALLLATQIPFLADVFAENRAIWGVLAGGAIVVAVGVADDVWDLDWMTKFAGQILGAGVMAWLGVQFYSVPLFGVTVVSGRLSFVLTLVLTVALMNAVNFIDGLDGLAAGVIAIGGSCFFTYTYLLAVGTGASSYANAASLLIVALVGACLGFLPHNVYPARIFMGDSGSMFLGFVFAAAAITVTGQIDQAAVSTTQSFPVFLPLLLPLAVVAVPIMDLVMALFRRAFTGKSPFAADRKHLHHRMLDLGHSHPGAVRVIWLWAAVISVGTASLVALPMGQAGILTAIGIVVATVVSLVPVRARSEKGST